MLENNVMAKVLVLFDNRDHRGEQLAELAAQGAKRVRFAEVDVRAVGDDREDSMRRKHIESADEVAQYDGVIVAASDHDVPGAIDTLLATLERSNERGFVDRVFGSIGGGNWLNQRLAAGGGIVIGTRSGAAEPEAQAGATGERVAKVAEWVRHALSHEHGHSHAHHAHSAHPH
jgi:hypothetical protein